jgi:hypothetical protein
MRGVDFCAWYRFLTLGETLQMEGGNGLDLKP